MKKTIFIIGLVLIILASNVTALDFFTSRMNFPPDESRTHLQTITYTGDNLSVSIPSGFTLLNFTPGGNVNGSSITWGSGTEKNINYTFASPSDCTENNRYLSNIMVNGTLQDNFVFVCIPDSKIVDYKIEYGHGDANYLSDLFITNESTTLFNLIRIFNIGHHLTPNEDAVNVSIQCAFENFTVRTYGRTEISYNGSQVISNFSWDRIPGGYWFRIGVVGQDFTPKPIGEFYNVSCSQLTYSYNNQKVIVPNLTYSLEVRSCTPLQISFADYLPDASKIKVDLKNQEKYTLFDLFFEKILDGFSKEDHIIELAPNNSASFLTDRNSTYNFGFHFIPSWYRNSRNPQYCVQNFFFNGSLAPIISQLNNIPDVTFLENTIFSNLDLDNFVSDVDSNNSVLVWSASTPANISIAISNATHVVTFTPDAGFFGNRSVTFTVTDPDNLSSNQSIQITVLPIDSPPFINPVIPTQLRAPNSGLFTLNLTPYENDVDDNNPTLLWSTLGVNSLCINISMNTSVDLATITPITNLPCQDMVTFVLTDSTNLTAQQEVEIRYNATMDLVEGFNLISFPPLANLSVTKILAPLGNGNFGCGRNSTNISICNISKGDFNGTWNSVQTFNVSSGEFLVFNPTDYFPTIPQGQEFQIFDVLRGYWIEMIQNDTLELDVENE